MNSTVADDEDAKSKNCWLKDLSIVKACKLKSLILAKGAQGWRWHLSAINLRDRLFGQRLDDHTIWSPEMENLESPIRQFPRPLD